MKPPLTPAQKLKRARVQLLCLVAAMLVGGALAFVLDGVYHWLGVGIALISIRAAYGPMSEMAEIVKYHPELTRRGRRRQG